MLTVMKMEPDRLMLESGYRNLDRCLCVWGKTLRNNVNKVIIPTVNGRKKPVAVLEDGKRVDGDRGYNEQEVEYCQSHQQSVKWIFPQLK